MIRAALFDLDGTLVDSLPELHAGAVLAARELGLVEPGRETIGRMVGRGIRVLCERLADWWRAADPRAAELSTETALEVLERIWTGMSGEGAAELPGAFEGVRALKAAGVRTALVTNKIRPMTEAFLSSHGLGELFDVVLTGSDAERLKPAPDLLRLALEQLGVSAREAVMVGDSANDALAARAAGTDLMLVDGGYNEGVAVRDWARANGFPETCLYASAADACRVLLQKN